MTVLYVEKPGLLTTVQDLGRHGFQAYGLPAAGAADPYALQLANVLAGNDPGEAALEMTLAGPVLRVLAGGLVAVAGADLEARRNGSPLPLWETVAVQSGDVLSFGGARRGCRAYLALGGGVAVPEVLGSRSTYLRCRLGGLEGRALRAGDRVASREETGRIFRRVPAPFVPEYGASHTVRVVPGPQDDHFTPAGVQAFLTGEYRVANDSDRMGCRLAGPAIEHRPGMADIVSDGVPPGAVQVPGHGQPIVLLADRQTTGGYPKIACVVSTDLWRLAQAKPGDSIRFVPVSLDEAHRLYRIYREQFVSLCRQLRTGDMAGKQYRVSIGGTTHDVWVEESVAEYRKR